MRYYKRRSFQSSEADENGESEGSDESGENGECGKKICQGFGEYSNFMPKGGLWRMEILTKIADMTKVLQTFKQYRESTESGKKSPKDRGKFKLDYKRNSL